MTFLRSVRVWIGAFLALGLFASAYLLVVYVTGGPIVCGQEGACEVVRASKWAYVGSVPRPALGVVFYTGMLILFLMRAISAWRPVWLRRLAFLGAVVGLAESVHLFLIQWLDIKAFCLWCLASGAATLAVFVLSFFDKGELSASERLADLRGYAAVFFAFVVLGVPGLLFLTR